LLLETFLRDGRLTKKDTLTLRGQLAFGNSFVFGRIGQLALRDITKHAYANPFVAKL
jgi:hypothetical protein